MRVDKGRDVQADDRKQEESDAPSSTTTATTVKIADISDKPRASKWKTSPRPLRDRIENNAPVLMLERKEPSRSLWVFGNGVWNGVWSGEIGKIHSDYCSRVPRT
jgi:hypothetical protein